MMCPAGQSWNADTCMCECTPKACPAGSTWDPASCQCVACSKQCPSGQTLNTTTCQCETACLIDPVIGAPDGCGWAGTISIVADSSGEADQPPAAMAGFRADHASWSFSYNASLVADPASTAWNLGGSVSGVYHEVDTLTVPTCSETETIESTLSESQAMFMALPLSPGTFWIDVLMRLDAGAVITGTATGSSSCSDSTTADDPLLGGIVGFQMSPGPASGSSFSGSNPDALPNDFELPDGSYVKFKLTWDLRLVRL